MRTYWTLTWRELGAYFLSVTGYVIIAGVLFQLGFAFVDLLEKLQQGRAMPMPVSELFFCTNYYWFILLLTTPVITMRLFSLEKFSGTFETLMTTPVGDLEVVLAKFSAALGFYILCWLPLLGCLLVVRYYTNETSAIDAGVVASSYLGIILLGALFVALGCFASALTRNQAVAAMVSLAFEISLYLLAYLADRFPETDHWQAQVLAFFAFFEQMRDFVHGVVDTRAVLLYVTLTCLFLFLTLRVVESRRWK